MTQIRKVTAADYADLWPLLRAVFRKGDTYAVDPQISREAALAYWTGGRACYVAVDGSQIIGTYYIKTNQPGGGAHICNCGYIVSAAAQGQGLAAAMCAHSQQEARALGYSAMQFNFVLASNTRAVALWQRLGFATIGTIPEAFVHPDLGLVAAHIMHKTLD